MKPYQHWIEQSDRWRKCVDYSSVPSAWTLEMFEILKACNGDKLLAGKELAERRRASVLAEIEYEKTLKEWLKSKQ